MSSILLLGAAALPPTLVRAARANDGLEGLHKEGCHCIACCQVPAKLLTRGLDSLTLKALLMCLCHVAMTCSWGQGLEYKSRFHLDTAQGLYGLILAQTNQPYLVECIWIAAASLRKTSLVLKCVVPPFGFSLLR